MNTDIQIKHYEHNPRQITKQQFERLKDTMEEFGDLSGIVINLRTDEHGKEFGELVGGNQRSEAGKFINSKPVIVNEYDPALPDGTIADGYFVYQGSRFNARFVRWDADRVLRGNLIANIAGGSWDWDELSALPADVLGMVGFDESFIDTSKLNIKGVNELIESQKPPLVDTESQIDRAAELLEKWQVKAGDLWQIGEHRLLCGDSTKREDVERLMGGERAQMVFTDPPYGVAIGEKNKFLNSFQRAGGNLENIAGDLLGKDELFDMLVLSFTLTKDIMDDCCSIYVTAPQGGKLGMMMMMMMMMSGLPVRHVLNWVKNSPTFSMGRLDYEYQHEPILYTWKKTHIHFGKGIYGNTSVWNFDKPRSSKEHPTMKPVELVENAILNSSDTGWVIYDSFCGSGTTLVACQNLGRRGRGIEISPAYCAVILERMSTAFPDIEIKRI